MQKQRFKDKKFNDLYWLHIGATPQQVEKMLTQASSNWDMAFKHGYKGYPCKFQRNWILYPIYVAGKEYKKVNKIA